MTQFSTEVCGRRTEMNFDLETAHGLDRLIAVSHHAQQKVCATILQSSVIEQMLDRKDLDREVVRKMLTRIMAVSYSAAEAMSELQKLALEHIGIAEMPMPSQSAAA